ncbi:hypothetical protein ISN44_As08g022820 [Arabidopsis suecica]|uniref:GRF-type domain-containing protein n=1 Tax=Arabidopsis suecica TaxID=45249 RepID=A0A8T2BFK1_ARASU|nr:hypothetical protein ISN44_As08g022820 [Arabidopsis suecica]
MLAVTRNCDSSFLVAFLTVVMMRIFLSYKKLFKVSIVDKNHRRLEQVPPQAKQVDDHARKVHAQQLILARPGNAKLGIPPSSSKSLSCPILPSSSKSLSCVRIFTSKTQENLGRPFFRCLSKKDASSWTSKIDGHLFKWVEDAVYEEVEDALPKLGIMANEIVKAKSEVNEANVAIQEFKEDAMWSKMELRKLKVMLKVCLVWLSLMTIVIAYLMLGKAKHSKFVLGY